MSPPAIALVAIGYCTGLGFTLCLVMLGTMDVTWPTPVLAIVRLVAIVLWPLTLVMLFVLAILFGIIGVLTA